MSDDADVMRIICRKVKKSEDILIWPEKIWKIAYASLFKTLSKSFQSDASTRLPGSMSKNDFDAAAPQIEGLFSTLENPTITILLYASELNRLNDGQEDDEELHLFLVNIYSHLFIENGGRDIKDTRDGIKDQGLVTFSHVLNRCTRIKISKVIRILIQRKVEENVAEKEDTNRVTPENAEPRDENKQVSVNDNEELPKQVAEIDVAVVQNAPEQMETKLVDSTDNHAGQELVNDHSPPQSKISQEGHREEGEQAQVDTESVGATFGLQKRNSESPDSVLQRITFKARLESEAMEDIVHDDSMDALEDALGDNF